MSPDEKLKRITEIYDATRDEGGLIVSADARHNLEGAIIAFRMVEVLTRS
jgi:hypothetical protein